MIGSKWMRHISRWTARYYLKRPDQAELIYIKHPRIRDLWPALLNEVCFRLRTSFSFRLNGLNVELTNRCNLACRHCLLPGEGGRKKEDMDVETFRRIIDQAPFVKTILPFHWGEPLLNPALYDCISYAARRGIRVMLTTNGTLLDDKASRRLIESGLSRLTVSFDGNRETHAMLRGVDPDRVLSNAALFRRIRDETGSDCALDASMVVDKVTEGAMEDFKSIFADIADRIQYIPRFVKGPRKQPCRELWRGVLVVLSNGDVTVCCADEGGEAVIGNVAKASLPELFNADAIRRLRRRHRKGDYPPPCRNCAEYDTPRVSPRFS